MRVFYEADMSISFGNTTFTATLQFARQRDFKSLVCKEGGNCNLTSGSESLRYVGSSDDGHHNDADMVFTYSKSEMDWST